MRAEGHWRSVAANVLQAEVRVLEWRGSIIGSTRKTEWIPKKREEWYIALDPVTRRFERLDTQANAMSDNEAARRLNSARATMFKTIYNRSKSAA